MERHIDILLHKIDFIEALCFIMRQENLFTKQSGSSPVELNDALFDSYVQSISVFLGSSPTAKYGVTLLYREDGRIYLKDLQQGSFNLRKFIVEESTELTFISTDSGIQVRLNLQDDFSKSLYEGESEVTELSYNKLIYGAPGTSKSWTVDHDIVKGHKTFRVTFHPDTDYASFVGCYKPETKEVEENGVTTEKIVYGFHKQVFLEAYIYAWSHPDEQTFLVIEEINRGHCAQIFGDVFQLLDRREDGFSKYVINADTDVARALKEIQDYKEKFIEHYSDVENHWEDNLMALPSNLSLIATMNTSDQSLYQMDSAFKRRWDMVYFPIRYDDADKAVLDLGGGNRYKWGDVLRVLNAYIKEETESSNKCIGNRFIDFERTGNVIDYTTFRDKVLFYLFTDVFKDNMDFAKDFFGEDKFGKGYKFFEDLCEHEDEGPAITDKFLQDHKGGIDLTKQPGTDKDSVPVSDATAADADSPAEPADSEA